MISCLSHDKGMESVSSFVFYLLALFAVTVAAELRSASVKCIDQTCNYKFEPVDTGATAYGVYNDTLTETGWGILNISAGHGAETNNSDLMFAAGFLEGILTQKRIYQHYINLEDWFITRIKNDTKAVDALKKFFTEQDIYMRNMIRTNVPSSPFWRHVSYILAQYDGLVAGYRAVAPSDQSLPLYAFQVLNGAGDLLDLVNVVSPKNQPDWRKMTKEEAVAFVARSGHCSALIKVMGAYEDVFMSHSSWFAYQATMRIFKHYDFNVDDEATAAKRISFSSYPGFLESLDDFYMLSSQMVMLQTTNNVFDMSLYKLVTPESLLAWQRVRVANMMAHTGKEWATTLAQQNSGTYNNQYMVLDLKQIELKKAVHDNALWVVEQIPGLVAYDDVSMILREGYWPSYNVPFFDKVYERSGYPEFVAKHGLDFSYQLAPRAKIFRRDEGTVKDMVSMKKIMRYNDYKEDPYSEGDSCNAICCRGDLRGKDPGPFGCYDTKVTDYNMALNFEADIVNGPTLGTGLPPFSWNSSYKQSHIGLPKVYDFPFIHTKPMMSPGRS